MKNFFSNIIYIMRIYTQRSLIFGKKKKNKKQEKIEELNEKMDDLNTGSGVPILLGKSNNYFNVGSGFIKQSGGSNHTIKERKKVIKLLI